MAVCHFPPTSVSAIVLAPTGKPAVIAEHVQVSADVVHRALFFHEPLAQR